MNAHRVAITLPDLPSNEEREKRRLRLDQGEWLCAICGSDLANSPHKMIAGLASPGATGAAYEASLDEFCSSACLAVWSIWVALGVGAAPPEGWMVVYADGRGLPVWNRG